MVTQNTLSSARQVKNVYTFVTLQCEVKWCSSGMSGMITWKRFASILSMVQLNFFLKLFELEPLDLKTSCFTFRV